MMKFSQEGVMHICEGTYCRICADESKALKSKVKIERDNVSKMPSVNIVSRTKSVSSDVVQGNGST